MQVIKDRQLIEDTWHFVADDAAIDNGNTTVSLTRWQQNKQQLQQTTEHLGVRLGAADAVADLAADLKDLQLIELDFPEFADGRLFSQAWLLRSRYQFQGEIRAVGQFMPDQVFYLSRVGVNAFQPHNPEHLADVLAKLNDFSVNYQRSIN